MLVDDGRFDLGQDRLGRGLEVVLIEIKKYRIVQGNADLAGLFLHAELLARHADANVVQADVITQIGDRKFHLGGGRRGREGLRLVLPEGPITLAWLDGVGVDGSRRTGGEDHRYRLLSAQVLVGQHKAQLVGLSRSQSHTYFLPHWVYRPILS